jgi:hypothetical protein
MPVLPPKIRLFSVQHNGVFVFVSNDMAGPDHIVEAHPAADEFRNVFEVTEFPDGNVRLFNPATGMWLFVSNDMEGADHVVEGHPFRDEDRNVFTPRRQPDGSFTFFHPSTRTFMFVSNDTRGNDFVIEAHGPDELRNRFQIRLPPGQ